MAQASLRLVAEPELPVVGQDALHGATLRDLTCSHPGLGPGPHSLPGPAAGVITPAAQVSALQTLAPERGLST
eukprot:1932724-Rhodomonas_salina.1